MTWLTLTWLVIAGVASGLVGTVAGLASLVSYPALIAALLLLTGDTLARVSATRTTLLFLANGVAALGFALFGPVHWAAAVCMGIGTLIGGRLGLAIHLGIDAY